MDKLYVNLDKIYRQVKFLQNSNIHTISKWSIIIRVFFPHYGNMTRPLELYFLRHSLLNLEKLQWQIQRRFWGFHFPTPPPPPPFLNILWKWNSLVSVRPNYFIFNKNEIKSAKRPHLYTPFTESLDPPLHKTSFKRPCWRIQWD